MNKEDKNMKEERTAKEWIKEHKTELICGGIGIVAVVGILFGIKNRDAIKTVVKGTELLPQKAPAPVAALHDITPVADNILPPLATPKRAPHEVARHLRKLPEGYKASAEKIAAATELGYALQPGQTFVEAYRTGKKAA